MALHGSRAIAWLGSTEHWPDVPQGPGGNEKFLMPLIEETVLEVAFSQSPLRKMSTATGLDCTSKYRLRRALEPHGLNPLYTSIPWTNGVLKAPASVTNKGIWYLKSSEHIDRLKSYDPFSSLHGVLEEYIPGPQYDVEGVRFSGEAPYFFHVLLEHWNDDGDRIESYERVDPPRGLLESAALALEVVDLRDAPFSIELRRGQDGWKVIDMHARLGEDPGLPAMLCDDNPLEVIEYLAQKRVS